MPFKVDPWLHQKTAYERFKDSTYCGLLFEQRCGKTATILAIAAHKYLKKEIDSLLIVAPNGISYQWIHDAIPEHLVEETRYQSMLWQASMVKRVGVRQKLKELWAYADGLRILSVNVDAINTKDFKGYANAFFRGHRVMTVVDESGDLANHKSLRSKAALKLGRASRVRAVLDGTPIAAGPLGLFGQCLFLSPDALGFDNFFAFRAHYAEMEKKDFGERDRPCPDCAAKGWISTSVAGNHDVEVPCPRCRGNKFVGKNEVQVVKSYTNLDELQGRLSRFSTRVLRSECFDLPPKIYQKAYFDLSPDARRHYDELRDHYVTELRSGGVVTAAMVLTRYLRLQQVASGFLPSQAELLTCPACEGKNAACLACEGLGLVEDATAPRTEPLGATPDRLEAFLQATEKLQGPGIVWCKFDHDVDAVVRAARAADRRVVQYDGRVTAAAKAEAVVTFQGGAADLFVAKPRSAGRGHDLAAASWVAYYSHDFSLRMRLQSEDRAQSGRKRDSVLYLDLIALDTVDDKIVEALRAGKRISDLITGDDPGEWL